MRTLLVLSSSRYLEKDGKKTAHTSHYKKISGFAIKVPKGVSVHQK